MTKEKEKDTIPAVFDWVKARAECNPERVFDDLIGVIKSDIESAEKSGIDCRVACQQISFRSFTFEAAMDPRGFARGYVLVELDQGIIVAYRERRDPSCKVLEAKPHVSLEGDCMLEIDDCPYRLWQVSKMIFEDVFFRRSHL